MKIMLGLFQIGNEVLGYHFFPDTGQIKLGVYTNTIYDHDDLSFEGKNSLDNEHDGMWRWQGKPIAYKCGDVIYKMTDLVQKHIDGEARKEANKLHDFQSIKDGSLVVVIKDGQDGKYFDTVYCDYLYQSRGIQIKTYKQGAAFLKDIKPEDLDEAVFWLNALREKEQEYAVSVMKTLLQMKQPKSCLFYEFHHDDEKIEWIMQVNETPFVDKQGRPIDLFFEGECNEYTGERGTVAQFHHADYDGIEQFLATMDVYRVTPPTRKKIDNWIDTIR